MKTYSKINLNSPSVKDIISEFSINQINIILIGSEAGKIYNLCDSKKDIDFLIENTKENLNKLYCFLSKFFTLENFDDFTQHNRYILYPPNEKAIEIFNHNGTFVTYEDIKEKKTIVNFYDENIYMIHLDDYIDYIKKAKKYYQNNFNSTNYKKYANILKVYQERNVP